MSELNATLDLLRATAVATIATVLKQKGFRNIWMRGPQPILSETPRIAGPAFTLRFIPIREDIPVQEAVLGPASPRAAIPKIAPGSVVVIDAMGAIDAGVMGDILCARMRHLGVAGLVTDGAVRDVAGMRSLGWPVWAKAASAPPSTAALYCADNQTPVACGGVAVFPGDIIVADDDGAVVVPAAIAREVAEEAHAEDRFEEWVCQQVLAGAALEGLYPPNDETKARFRAASAI